MCRGDRREEIFREDRDREIFLRTLGETCKRAGWMIHAYVLMGNHYHLLLETVAGELSRGMQWFQTTYTARFNARHRLCGHLFQGRYKAVLIDPEEQYFWKRLGDYIHMNPVRAGLIPLEKPRLDFYRWSSYPAFLTGKNLPAWLSAERTLGAHGWDCRKSTDRRAYQNFLQGRCDEVLATKSNVRGDGEEDEWAEIRRGWFLGAETFRNHLIEKLDSILPERKKESLSGEAVTDRGVLLAEKQLQKCLETLGLDCETLAKLPKNDLRKQAVAWLLRTHTSVKNDWIQDRLNMGHRNNIARAVRVYEEKESAKARAIRKIIVQCAD